MRSHNEEPESTERIDLFTLKSILHQNEDWLMERILEYAIHQGYAAYTSTLKEAWRLSISGLTASIIDGINHHQNIPEMSPKESLVDDPVAVFGVVEAQRHRERGISLEMFLGLLKYYRQSYIDLLERSIADHESGKHYQLFINRIFDRIEIALCIEWSGASGDQAIHELQVNNRMMTNEKNKYLTIFESIPNPVIILNSGFKIDNMNLSAARLIKDDLAPGSQYYCLSRDRHLEAEQYHDGNKNSIDPSCFGGHDMFELLPWLKNEVSEFIEDSLLTLVFEKEIHHQGQRQIFRVRFTKSLDISGKFDGTVIVMEDITSLKSALEEVKTLRGFVPICSHCKNIRDDSGFWQKVEQYVQDRSHAEFSHSICPECAKKHYPDLDIYDD